MVTLASGIPAAIRPMHLRLSAAPHFDPDDGVARALALLDAALLAWLALEGPTPRARLAQLLWPDKDAEAARNSLRQRLFQLRKQLGADLVGGSTTLALADGVTHDLDDADGVLGATAADDLAPGEFALWLEQQRARRRDRVRRSLVELAEMAERANDFDDALTHARELLALEPLSEEAHRRVMRQHYLAGDRAAALLAFDRCEQLLKDEVGARPSAETLALLHTIERSMEPDGAALPMRAPAAVLRPPRLVGRSVELAAASQAWASQRAFCLEGEPGLGKSRLLQEIAAQRGQVLSVQARPGDHVVPYATLSRLLQAIARHPALAAAPSARATAAEHAALMGQASVTPQAAGRWVERAISGGIEAILIDDLHFADDASLDWLLEWLRGTEAPLPCWGFARRPNEGSASLVQFVDALLQAHRLDPVALRPLTREQLAELLASLGIESLRAPEFVAALHRHSGGNPLFALETLRHAWAQSGLAGQPLPRPINVTRTIERRVMRLSPAAVRIARCAAVAGTDFSIDLAAKVLASPVIDLADAWNELEQAHVFVDGAFAHDLIFEAVRASLPQAIARHLHGEVARHLEQRPHAPPAAIAEHWLAAQAVQQALPFLHRAGEAAAAQRRFGEAAATYEREARLRLQCGDAQGAYLAAQALRKAAFQLDLAHRTDAALDLLDQAASTPQQRAFACAERAIVHVHRGAMADAERAVEAGLQALGNVVDPAVRSMLLQHLAAVRLWQNRAADANDLLRSIERDVADSGSPESQIEFAQALAVVQEHLDLPVDAARWHRRAADLSLAHGDVPRAAQCMLNLALGHRDAGRLDLALAGVEEAQRLLTSLPEGEIPYSSLDTNFGLVLRDLGRLGESIEWLDRAIERGRVHMPGWVANFHAHRAQTWLYMGQFARAQQDLDAAGAISAPPLARSRCDLVRALMLCMRGLDATAVLEAAQAHLGAGARALMRQRLALARCVILEPAEALAVAGEVLDAATVSQRPGLVIAARARMCQAALRLGHASEAARHARHLAAIDANTGSDDLYRGEIWLTAVQALMPLDPAHGLALLQGAVSWVRERAAHHVPEAARDSFLHRNPFNRELLALSARLAPR
ncbi:MAG TPA: BTAD domain-containing putative transcriptional regulator [Burkholderiaceae bacterium]